MLLSGYRYLICALFNTLVTVATAKSSCDICKDIVSSFQSGLEKTVKSNFGGGNTNWEEKSLGKWKTSETRLVEIIDHHICEGNDKKCHMFFERNEESLEDWYFNIYKDLDSSDSLQQHLCIEKSKACCPDGKYGKDCSDCPSAEAGICGGNGKCKGDGTRDGDGTCDCSTGYGGTLCDECEEGYYQQLTGTVKVCLECDRSCEDSCTGPGPKACDDCTDGYTWDDDRGCQDDDECLAETDPCQSKEGTFCENSLGSYSCKSCHHSCESCTGDQPSHCQDCIEGYERETTNTPTSTCVDVDECSVNAQLCDTISGTECLNTEGSYDCTCKEDNQHIDGDKCIDNPPIDEQKPEETNTSTQEPIENSQKGKRSKAKKAEGSRAKPVVNMDNGKPKIDIDAMMDAAGKLPGGQKRRYRTLDTMTLVSSTGLYLVMCLVFHAEFYKTSLVSILYSVFIYSYSGMYV